MGFILKPFKPSGIFKHEKAGYKLQLNTNVRDNKIHPEHSYMAERMGTTVFYGEPPNQTGKYIGMLERLIIVILVIANAVNAIGFLVALKALTRFKQFDDKDFAEYYLIGSLLSILLGLISGFFAMKILLL